MFSLYVAGVDYQSLTSKQVIFGVGPNTHEHCIEVRVLDDDVVEGEEYFPAVIESASPMSGVMIDTSNMTEVTIEDDDGMTRPQLYIALQVTYLHVCIIESVDSKFRDGADTTIQK